MSKDNGNPLDAGGWPIMEGAKVRVHSMDCGREMPRTKAYTATVKSVSWDEEGFAMLIMQDKHGRQRYADAKQVKVMLWQSPKR